MGFTKPSFFNLENTSIQSNYPLLLDKSSKKTILRIRMSIPLSSETIECFSLTLEGINDVHCSYCLAAGMFSVSDRVADNILEKDLYMYS